MPEAPFQHHRSRRDRIAARLERENGVLVLGAGSLRTRSNDTEFRFRPDSDFHYLTGLSEPGAFLVLRPGTPSHAAVFVRPRDRDAEIWAGRRLGPDGARTHCDVEEGLPLDRWPTRLAELLDGAEIVYTPLTTADPGLLRGVQVAIEGLARRNRTGETPPTRLGDARWLVGEDRMTKDPAALASLRRAVHLSAIGHVEAMRRVEAGMWEYQVEALVEYEFRRHGGDGPGYTSIVASGRNATILHYVDNREQLKAGKLLLIDAGCECDLFTGDITRTFPISGHFSPAQRDLYEVVLAANLAGIAATTVGSDIDAIHKTALDVLCNGLSDLGLVRARADEILERGLYRRYYMHRTSHWLGADVHDAGRYTLDRKPRPLCADFVLTVEPGLYIAEDDESAPEELRGTGIRIEDDVRVTSAGPEVLSAGVPKTVAAIESSMDR